jgi:rhodanese-related sulfurtransferase
MGGAQVTLRPQEFSALTNDIRRIDARQLKVQLHDGEEIAVLDAREEGVFARRHHLLASCVPLSRLELLVDDLVPRRTTRVVWCDDGDGTALLAARRMAALGYQMSRFWKAASLRGKQPAIASTAAFTFRAKRLPRSSSVRPVRRGFPRPI